MNKLQIYFLEDDRRIAAMAQEALGEHNYDVFLFDDYRIFFDAIKRKKPHLIVLDLALPIIDGRNILTYLKKNEHTKDIPVIIESGTLNDASKIYCLDNGADDYLCKPYSMLELKSRINAVLRRYLKQSDNAVDDIKLFSEDNLVVVNNHEVKLKNKEFVLLEYLLAHHESLISKEVLINKFWPNATPNSRSLDMHIAALREKVFAISSYELKTVLKKGFKLEKNKV